MTETEKDSYYMGLALEEAKRAAAIGEIPVGAVVVRDDKVIAMAYNLRETEKNALHHAEILAIDRACRALGGFRLIGCTLYVTLEPCPMCAGAIINARLPRVVFGATDPKAGSCGSVLNLFDYPYNHKPELVAGVRGEEAAKLLSDFFRELRAKRKKGN